MIALIVLLCVVLLLAGTPVCFAFGIGSIILCWFLNIDFNFVMPISYQLVHSYLFLALPLYILAGHFLGLSGIADRLVKLFTTLFGQIRGGLGAAVIITNVIFGAVSGAASSAVGALGTILIPRMAREGYPRGYAVALIAASAVLSLLVPPSLAMIIFGVLAHLPITILFLCTVGPATILVILFLIINVILCKKMPNVKVNKLSKIDYIRTNKENFKSASLGLAMPLIILGGIYSGIFTPTEAACVAVLYCIPVGFFVYRTFNINNTIRSIKDSAVVTASIIIVFFFLFIFSRIFIVGNIPEYLIQFILKLTSNKYVIYMLLNVLMIIIGMIMDDTSGLVIAAIIIAPVASNFGMDPRQFAAVAGVCTGMGLITPPVSPTLFMAARVGGDVDLEEYLKPALIYVLFGYLPVLILTTYVPAVSLWLPSLIIGKF